MLAVLFDRDNDLIMKVRCSMQHFTCGVKSLMAKWLEQASQ